MTTPAPPRHMPDHELMESIVHTVGHPLVVLDRERRIVMINRSFCRKFGVDPREAVGKSIFELDGGRWDTAALRQLLGELLVAKRNVEDFEIEHESATRGRRILSLNVRKMFRPGSDTTTILVSIADVTRSRRKAEAAKKARDDLRSLLRDKQRQLARSEAALSETEAILLQFLECIPFGVFVIDRNGVPYFANDAAVEVLGKGIVAGTTADDLAQVYDVYIAGTDTPYPNAQLPVVRALAGEATTTTDIEIHRPDAIVPLWVSAAPIRDAAGVTQYAISVFQDVSKRQQLEAQYRQAQRMEAVGRLAGGVAHDFNNLLTAIFAFVGFAMDGMNPNDPARADLQEVVDAARRAQALTGQLLAFSRRQIVAPKVINITSHVREMQRMLRRILGEDIEFDTHLDDALWNIHVDPGALEQVIVNLAVNSRDAMPDGGKLTIETANVVVGSGYGRLHGVEVPAGNYVCVVVSDSGAGIDAEIREHIFEPFFTTKGATTGTGLGLATCYGIVKQAGGYIWVYSELGQGTTFKVYFPQVVAPSERVEPRAQATPTGGNETILIAEDDEQVRRLAVRTLKRAGYRVLEAENGGEALLVGDELPALDLLLTDVVMPRMSGKLLADRLSRRHPGLRVLYMSGYTSNTIVHHGVLDAGLELLQKPYSPDDLLLRVRVMLDTALEAPRRARVLLVDDNAAELRALERKLRGDYDITLATGGRAARQLLQHGDFDLVLCDILMPDLDGMQLHQEIRHTRPDLAGRFVFMTAADHDAVAAFLDSTDRAVLSKPVPTSRLHDIVADALAAGRRRVAPAP